MKNKIVSVDFDGVLCKDPESGYEFGSKNYIDFLKTAEPISFAREYKINEIISGRRMIYKDITIAWLKKHGFIYNKLYLKPTDIPIECTPVFKAEIYKKSKSELYIESSIGQAILISILSKRGVMCSENGVLYE